MSEEANPSVDPAASASAGALPPTVQAILRAGAQQLGLALSEEQIGQFEAYSRALVEWNERLNLTAITGYEEVQTKHFLDCLAGWPIVAAELGLGDRLTRPLHLVDVGTGAGFPGLPLKIAVPRLKVTLMDGTGKKVTFLRHVVEQLGLQNAGVVQGRAEELGHQTAFRGQFDLVTARAVAPLNTLVEYLLPLARKDALAVIYKGANVAAEFMEARKAVEALGGEVVRLAPVSVPLLDEKRFVVLIRKVRPTPAQFPRGQGLARKKPLG